MLEVCSVLLCCLNFTRRLSGLYLLQILNRDDVLMLSMMGQHWLEVGEILVIRPMLINLCRDLGLFFPCNQWPY